MKKKTARKARRVPAKVAAVWTAATHRDIDRWLEPFTLLEEENAYDAIRTALVFGNEEIADALVDHLRSFGSPFLGFCVAPLLPGFPDTAINRLMDAELGREFTPEQLGDWSRYQERLVETACATFTLDPSLRTPLYEQLMRHLAAQDADTDVSSWAAAVLAWKLIETNTPERIAFLKQAALEGHFGSAVALGNLYLEGDDAIAADVVEAVRWYVRSGLRVAPLWDVDNDYDLGPPIWTREHGWVDLELLGDVMRISADLGFETRRRIGELIFCTGPTSNEPGTWALAEDGTP